MANKSVGLFAVENQHTDYRLGRYTGGTRATNVNREAGARVCHFQIIRYPADT